MQRGEAPADSLVRAFLIADVRGYTSFTQTHGDEAAAHLAATFAALARETVATSGGAVVGGEPKLVGLITPSPALVH
jgi:class 3 adenylate cyclase